MFISIITATVSNRFGAELVKVADSDPEAFEVWKKYPEEEGRSGQQLEVKARVHDFGVATSTFFELVKEMAIEAIKQGGY